MKMETIMKMEIIMKQIQMIYSISDLTQNEPE